jgi:cell filamentation protein
MTDRYDTTDNPEDECYPNTSVLINTENIRDPEELLERETELQLIAYEAIFTAFDEGLIPDLPFFYYLHHMMFSPLFVWAGRPRTVGISKGGTPFCPPQNIDAMMNSIFAELEQERWLDSLDPDSFMERAAYYICEINAMHPFREGNGALSDFT